MISTLGAFDEVARQVLLPRAAGVQKEQLAPISEAKKWSAFFGTFPVIIADVWNCLDPVRRISQASLPKHLLAFIFIKVSWLVI
jgi:hypothetical protein